MSSLLKKIKQLFISKEKIFINTLVEELENSDFINLRKVNSKLSIQQRYRITNKLISNRDISGILLPETPYLFSIQEEDLVNIRSQLKERGSIDIAPLKQKWEIKIQYIELLLLHFEKGILTPKTYYTMSYLRETILSTLKKEEDYNIKLFNEKLGVEVDDLIEIILSSIDEGLLLGVVQNEEMFVSNMKFEEMISEYIEEKFDLANELEFDEISLDLKVSQNYIEKYLVSIVEKNPGVFVVYPLEKKIAFKK